MRYACLVLILSLGCASLSKKPKAIPKITEKMPLTEVLANGIEYGGQTMADANRMIRKRGEWKKAEPHLYKLLSAEDDSVSPSSLINTMELFRASQSARSPQVFRRFVRNEALLRRQLAWQLASDVPSNGMGREIEDYLTEVVSENELNLAFVPAMADAVASNRLTDSYTIVREGLFYSNDIAFARAMITLNPSRSSGDFLEYLAKAPVEELRQMSMKSVDVYTCTLILEHFRAYPPPASNGRIETLFYYSISRNNALAEMARDVLEKYLPLHSEVFAFALSRLPSWMQLAFIERSSKRMTPVISLFLSDLKKVTADKDVSDEISGLKL